MTHPLDTVLARAPGGRPQGWCGNPVGQTEGLRGARHPSGLSKYIVQNHGYVTTANIR